MNIEIIKNNLSLIIILFISFSSFSQSIDSDKVSLTNFIKRMYNSAPFEGVKVIEDYDNIYHLSSFYRKGR